MEAERNGMEWKHYYETGIPVVDQQHQELFRQVGILLDYDKKRETQERIEETLTFLGEYVLKHFGTEEMMQKVVKYPLVAAHKEMHDNFVKTFLQLKSEFAAEGGNMLILMRLSMVAVDWLKEHILRHDKDFGEFYQTSRQ